MKIKRDRKRCKDEKKREKKRRKLLRGNSIINVMGNVNNDDYQRQSDHVFNKQMPVTCGSCIFCCIFNRMLNQLNDKQTVAKLK